MTMYKCIQKKNTLWVINPYKSMNRYHSYTKIHILNSRKLCDDDKMAVRMHARGLANILAQSLLSKKPFQQT